MAYEYSQARSDRKLERGATQFIEKAAEKARYWRDQKGIKPEKMPEDFGRDMVVRDTATVTARAAEIARRDTPEQKEEAKISEVFEVSLWWLAQNRGFFGEKTKAVLPSRYDDYMNGTDLILEVAGADNAKISRIGLGIDATYGVKAVQQKLDRLGSDVEAGKGGEIKYYVSADGKERRKLSGVPHLIVGLSVARAREVAQLWRRAEEKESTTFPPEAHPLRSLILQQLVMQTGALGALARKRGNTELAERYEAACAQLRPIYDQATSAYLKVAALAKEKPWKDILDQDYRRDPVHEAILLRTQSWRKMVDAR